MLVFRLIEYLLCKRDKLFIKDMTIYQSGENLNYLNFNFSYVAIT